MNKQINKDWSIDKDGALIKSTRPFGYSIHEDRLTEEDWIKHILSKDWDMNLFLEAYFYALNLRGVKTLTITANY